MTAAPPERTPRDRAADHRTAGTTRYLLDGLSVIAQYAPDGQRQAWYTQSLARIDEVLNVANDSGKYWYQADALGSVYGLTNQAGALIGSQSYDVFGAPTPAPSGPAGQPFGFTGREHELDSGLVYARARYLNPSTGRWDRADPLGQVAGPNYYGYVGARPTFHADPLGTDPLVGALIGAALGGYYAVLGAMLAGGSSKEVIIAGVIGAAVGALVGLVDLSFGAFTLAYVGGMGGGLGDLIGQIVVGRGNDLNFGSVIGATIGGALTGVAGGVLAQWAKAMAFPEVLSLIGIGSITGGAGGMVTAIGAALWDTLRKNAPPKKEPACP